MGFDKNNKKTTTKQDKNKHNKHLEIRGIDILAVIILKHDGKQDM